MLSINYFKQSLKLSICSVNVGYYSLHGSIFQTSRIDYYETMYVDTLTSSYCPQNSMKNVSLQSISKFSFQYTYTCLLHISSRPGTGDTHMSKICFRYGIMFSKFSSFTFFLRYLTQFFPGSQISELFPFCLFKFTDHILITTFISDSTLMSRISPLHTLT